MNGILLVDKPAGITSFGIIEQLRRLLIQTYGLKKKELPKMGHGGTLDPFATGLMIILLGKAAKQAQDFLGSTKGYAGRIRFGAKTASGDPTTDTIETCDSIPSSLDEMQSLAHRFTQEPYLQIPPMHSAKKQQGQRLYELARKGIVVEREPKSCQLSEFKITALEPPFADFDVKCSAGTYIRTLAEDFAQKLGSLAYLETLRRTSCGNFSIEQAYTLEQIADATEKRESWERFFVR